jgi:hypothetical protein
MEEILNIDYHRCRLILKSLNTSKTVREAANKCGISVRTLRVWCFNYDIIKDSEGKYQRKINNWLVNVV